ncbi:MAG: HEAT repeat domain-containing protein [Kiritimatiellia bacterium]|jgi:HEAT repeat protein|nr:HEAT repeat domain-containing protein [Kiritimatiellia bacterium]
MRYSRLTTTVLVLIAVAGSIGLAQDVDLKKTLDELLPAMNAEKIPDRSNAEKKWEEICFQLGAPGKEAQRSEACKLMVAKVGKDTPTPVRLWMLRQLERIGKDECVDATAALLDDKNATVRDAARRVLTNNPSPKANAVLLDKMQGTGERDFKVALLNSLGYRADPGSTAAAARELRNSDRAVAVAAAATLGKVGDVAAVNALVAARKKATGDLRRCINDACLACAENLLEHGKTREATAIYKELNKPEEGRTVQLAAMKGLLKAAGK